MLSRTIAAVVIFASMPAIGAVSMANAADRTICFKEQNPQLTDPCYNGLTRHQFEYKGTQNGAGQPHNFPGGHGPFPGAHDGKLDGPKGGHTPGAHGGIDGGGPQPG